MVGHGVGWGRGSLEGSEDSEGCALRRRDEEDVVSRALKAGQGH